MTTELVGFPTSRGAVLLTGSQAIGLIAAFITHVVLTRLLMPEIYGLYVVTVSVLAWMEVLVISSITAPFAKAVSDGTASASALWGLVWRSYLPFWVTLWLMFSVTAKWIAIGLKDERLLPLLLVTALELPFLGLNSACWGLLMGLRAYGWQAVAMVQYALLRLIGILTLTVITHSVFWALVGNIIAIVVAAVICIIMVQPFLTQSGSSSPSVPAFMLLAGLSLPFISISLLDQVTLALDLWLLKRMTEPQFAGFYGASRFFAFSLLMLTVGLEQSWFPAICQVLQQGERERAKALLKEALRVAFIGLMPVVAIVWVTAHPLTVLVFSPSFKPAAEPMKWLVIAIILFTLMSFMRGAFIADNDFRYPIIMTASMTAMKFILCLWLISEYGMKGAAMATTLTGLLGFMIALVLTTKGFGNDVFPVGTIVRAGIASLVIRFIASFWFIQRMMLIMQYLLLACLYGALLFALGEIGAKEFQILRIVFANLIANVASAVKRK